MTPDKRKKILTLIGGLAALVAFYFLYEHIRYVQTDNAQVDAHWVMLAPKVGGFITKVNVNEGQKVKANDVLAEIDDRDYQSVLTQANANLISVEARKKEAEKNYRRITELFAQGAVAQQQFDTANSSYSEIKAKYDSLSAQVAQAELNLENTKIKAPFDGFIAKKSVEIGQLASPGVPVIGFVSSTERWVTANFKETEIDSIKIGAEVDIDVDAIDHKNFTGQVESVSAATGATFSLLPPDNATGNFTKVVQRVPVKIKLETLNDDDIGMLRAGLSAVVKVHK
jgi:membrane fusion protein (multidrug efflux system)